MLKPSKRRCSNSYDTFKLNLYCFALKCQLELLNFQIASAIENVLQLERAPVPQGVQHQAGGALQEVPGQVPAPGDDQVKMPGQSSDVMI